MHPSHLAVQNPPEAMRFRVDVWRCAYVDRMNMNIYTYIYIIIINYICIYSALCIALCIVLCIVLCIAYIRVLHMSMYCDVCIRTAYCALIRRASQFSLQ